MIKIIQNKAFFISLFDRLNLSLTMAIKFCFAIINDEINAFTLRLSQKLR